MGKSRTRLTSIVIILTGVLTQTVPAWAMRQQSGLESRDTERELNTQLGPSAAGLEEKYRLPLGDEESLRLKLLAMRIKILTGLDPLSIEDAKRLSSSDRDSRFPLLPDGPIQIWRSSAESADQDYLSYLVYFQAGTWDEEQAVLYFGIAPRDVSRSDRIKTERALWVPNLNRRISEINSTGHPDFPERTRFEASSAREGLEREESELFLVVRVARSEIANYLPLVLAVTAAMASPVGLPPAAGLEATDEVTPSRWLRSPRDAGFSKDVVGRIERLLMKGGELDRAGMLELAHLARRHIEPVRKKKQPVSPWDVRPSLKARVLETLSLKLIPLDRTGGMQVLPNPAAAEAIGLLEEVQGLEILEDALVRLEDPEARAFPPGGEEFWNRHGFEEGFRRAEEMLGEAVSRLEVVEQVRKWLPESAGRGVVGIPVKQQGFLHLYLAGEIYEGYGKRLPDRILRDKTIEILRFEPYVVPIGGGSVIVALDGAVPDLSGVKEHSPLVVVREADLQTLTREALRSIATQAELLRTPVYWVPISARIQKSRDGQEKIWLYL